MVERRPASRVARPPPQGGGGTDPSGSLRQSRVRRRDGAGGCGRWKGTRPAAEAALLVSQGRDDRRATGAAGGSRVLAAGGGAVRRSAAPSPAWPPAAQAARPVGPQTRSSWGWRAGCEAAVRARGHSAERQASRAETSAAPRARSSRPREGSREGGGGSYHAARSFRRANRGRPRERQAK